MVGRCPVQSILAAAANALADAGEWEWCLVILEELEQLSDALEAQSEQEGEGGGGGGGGGGDDGDGNVINESRGRIEAVREVGVEAETVIRLHLDEAGLPVRPGDSKATAAAAATAATSAADTLATYAAAVRACGTGGAGVQAVVGILERMRWAEVEPREGTYAAAISAFQACGGVWEEAREGVGGLRVTAAEAARGLIEWEEMRGGGDGGGGSGEGSSPFLYRWVGGWVHCCCRRRCWCCCCHSLSHAHFPLSRSLL